MPSLEGVYEIKMSTTFASIDEAIRELRDKISKSKTVWINSIPLSLLAKIAPFLKNKDVRIILPLGEKPTDELKLLGDVSVTKFRVYKDYKGIDANMGEIYFADKVYNVAYTKDRILEIDTIEYERCIKCMRDMFESAWKSARK